MSVQKPVPEGAYITFDQDALKKLREPFPSEMVGKLPRLVCKNCSNKNCQEHKKQKCRECNNYISTAHIHLDYVGHANVTARLLNVDPLWSWQPMAFDEQGLPALVRNQQGAPIGLWIWLTVCGVKRPGFGSCEPGKFDPIKELIGDALRNAAMRFGVALDLWSKEELEAGSAEGAPVPAEPKTESGDASSGASPSVSPPQSSPEEVEGSRGETSPVRGSADETSSGSPQASSGDALPILTEALSGDSRTKNKVLSAVNAVMVDMQEEFPKGGINKETLPEIPAHVLEQVVDRLGLKVSA